jgi:ABC-type hemin transport system ATPase subunit
LLLLDDIVIKDDHIMAMGGLEQVDFGFAGIRMELQTKKDKSGNGKRVLLDGSISGRVRPGRMLAIMGPSGAGKSTVLHALAGRVKDSSKISLFGERFINGKPVAGDSMVPSAFIPQGEPLLGSGWSYTVRSYTYTTV